MQTKVRGESAFPWCTVNGNDVRNKQSALELLELLDEVIDLLDSHARAWRKSWKGGRFGNMLCISCTTREFRPEVATLGRWSQQRAKGAQSREDQLESNIFQQNQSSELLDEGVHKLKNAVHQQSSFCNGMGSDALATNSSLRESKSAGTKWPSMKNAWQS